VSKKPEVVLPVESVPRRTELISGPGHPTGTHGHAPLLEATGATNRGADDGLSVSTPVDRHGLATSVAATGPNGKTSDVKEPAERLPTNSRSSLGVRTRSSYETLNSSIHQAKDLASSRKEVVLKRRGGPSAYMAAFRVRFSA